jgi:uncharacterized protein YggE
MKKVFALLVVGGLFATLLAGCGQAPITVTSAPNIRTINAQGHGEIYIVPDVAYIYVGVRVDANEVSDALNKNNAQAQAVAEAVKSLGVDAKDIQTASFNVYPMSDYGMDGTITRKYFVVENTVYITVRDLSKLGNLLDAVVRSGANTINSISFDVLNKEAALEQARDMAIAKAKAEAEAIAKASGVTLGDLQTVNVYTNNGVVPVYDAKGGMGAASTSNVPVSAGQLVVTADANLTYEIAK